MEPRELKLGDVVQIDPSGDECFGASFMVVTDLKSWGATGYVTVPGKGPAYYRCEFSQMEFIGEAVFIRADEAESEQS